MLCEHNQKVLIEAVATKQPLPPEVQSHVDACPACGAALAQEQLLFASIEAGIRKTANAEVPQSFVPTLRVRLAQEPPLRRAQGVVAVWGYAAAAAVLILVLFPFGLRQFRAPKPIYDRTAQPSAPKSDLSSKQDLVPTSPALIARSQIHKKREASVTRAAEPDNSTVPEKLEILVPPDQALLLARYADALRTGSLVLDARAESKTATLGSPIELIEVAEVRVSPLPSLAAQ